MRLIKYTSKRLIGNTAMADYDRALQALKEAAERVDPELELQVSLVDKSEVYSTVNKAVKDVRNLEFTYSHRALQRNPKLALEYAEVAESLLLITKIVGARRKEEAKFRNKKFDRPDKKFAQKSNTTPEENQKEVPKGE